MSTSPRRKYLIDYACIGLAQAVMAIRPFVFIPYVTQHMGKEAYGVWTQVAVTALLLGQVLSLRMANQGNAIWTRWLPREGERTVFRDLSPADRAEMAGVVAILEDAFGAPFVNKWQGHAVHLPKLVQALPNAVFVWVTRDPLETAQSVLRARRDLMGDPYRSMSRVPSTYQWFRNADYVEQVCAYVLGVEADIARDSRLIGPDRFYRIGYEDFCQRPRRILADLGRWYENRTGYRLKPRARIPERFDCSRSVKVSQQELAALRKCLAEFDMDRLNGIDER